jgi:hypothetical protein
MPDLSERNRALVERVLEDQPYTSYGYVAQIAAVERSRATRYARTVARIVLSRSEAPSPDAQNAEGAAEREVGRYVYRRISALMDAKPDTPEAAELIYLATIAEGVEEYGEDACADHSLAPFPSPDGELLEAAKAVVAQWDTPNWKLTEPTGSIVNRLRSAILSAEARSSVGISPSEKPSPSAAGEVVATAGGGE